MLWAHCHNRERRWRVCGVQSGIPDWDRDVGSSGGKFLFLFLCLLTCLSVSESKPSSFAMV